MADLPILGGQTSVEHIADDTPKIRVLWCKTCGTIEELPDFVGHPDDDVVLRISVERHRFPSGLEHVGLMFNVQAKHWYVESARKQIIKQMKGGGSEGLNEADPTFYDTRNTFAEDALKCYAAHNRPKGGCPDYGSDKKQLVPDTEKDRKDLGLEKAKYVGPKVYLCQWCPVQSFYATKSREKKGLYS